MDIAKITAGQAYRYYLRQVVAGDADHRGRAPLRQAQQEAGVPPGRWMGRGLTALGLTPGQESTEEQLRNLFGQGRHPHAERIAADRLAAGQTPAAARRAGALGRRVKVVGMDLVFRPQPTVNLLWALGDDTTRKTIEAAHERAIVATLAWIEDAVAVLRYGTGGPERVRPAGGLVAARFRHYQARSGKPLLHDHVLLSLKAQRLGRDGTLVWGSVHTEPLYENTVAASALYNELVMTEVCEALGLASEPRTVSAGRPVMELAGIPHELIAWTATRSAQITACRTELELEYTTATSEDGAPAFAPQVSERARAKLNQIAAHATRPAKPPALPLARLREHWRHSAARRIGAAVVGALLERARAAAAAIRARIAAAVDIALAAVAVAATVFVMHDRGRFHRRHLLAEACRHLALTLRGARRAPGLDEQIVDAALAAHCTDITEPATPRGARPEYRLYTTRWTWNDLLPAANPPTTGPDQPSQTGPAAPRLPPTAGEWAIPRIPLRHDRATIAAAVLTTRLRTARRTGRPLYAIAAHQPPARPEQLTLFNPGDGAPSADRVRRGVDLATLRTDLEALHLTTGLLHRIGQAFTATGDQARQRMRQHPPHEPGRAPHPHPHRPDEHHRPEAGPDQTPGARR
ncbi:MobF family relaxase [Streptomyces radiopugnans]|uniref:MobF family relaxase n=1 Tax=Streptomyces radiopugnans TaxID=403935 RepID=UPI003F1BA316